MLITLKDVAGDVPCHIPFGTAWNSNPSQAPKVPVLLNSVPIPGAGKAIGVDGLCRSTAGHPSPHQLPFRTRRPLPSSYRYPGDSLTLIQGVESQ